MDFHALMAKKLGGKYDQPKFTEDNRAREDTVADDKAIEAALTFFWDANGLRPHFLLNIVIPFVNTLVLRFAPDRKAAVSSGLNFLHSCNSGEFRVTLSAKF